ncbi:hypothetical protein Dimus_007547 [Dionaea muscipula]
MKSAPDSSTRVVDGVSGAVAGKSAVRTKHGEIEGEIGENSDRTTRTRIGVVIAQCVARLDTAMFNAILRESEHEIPSDPVSDPIVDARVLPIPAGNLSFGFGAQLKNVGEDSGGVTNRILLFVKQPFSWVPSFAMLGSSSLASQVEGGEDCLKGIAVEGEEVVEHSDEHHLQLRQTLRRYASSQSLVSGELMRSRLVPDAYSPVSTSLSSDVRCILMSSLSSDVK